MMFSSKVLRPALVLLLCLSVLCGLLYPLGLTLAGHYLLPQQAHGSLLYKDGRLTGSRLIGQPFSSAHYFWGRPSATSPQPYHAAASGGANLGQNNPAWLEIVQQRAQALRAAHPGQDKIPVELVTASGSGLDPHISLSAAYYQAGRVARARGMPETELKALLARQAEHSWLADNPVVNVLLLNLALDQYRAAQPGS